ncbi:MAG TPA: SGNH/GDSL hydrolase family protein [Candidatus Hydrogenedentes bacterium]|nr:SGNH/GDSL hydrolase family protein [Candidatus Hydrogenedentota bacterium]
MLLIAQSAVAVAAMSVVLLHTNTLENNGRWRNSKSSLVAAMAVDTYQKTAQALARGHLNLGAWHGFQEMMYFKPVAIAELEFRLFLETDAYASLVCHQNEEESFGIRLSANPRFPSITFHATREGQFLEKKPVPIPPLSTGKWHRVNVRASGNGVPLLAMDGQPVQLEQMPWKPFTALGFRGCQTTALVDDVVAHQTDGTVIHDSFANRRHWLACLIAGFVAATLFNLLMLPMMKRAQFPPRHQVIGLVFLDVLIVVVLACVFTIVYFSQQNYPREGHFSEEVVNRVRNACVCILKERVREYAPDPGPGVVRIVFLGTSQTRGAGAGKPEHRFVDRIQRQLDDEAPAGTRYECINAGIGGGDSELLIELYRDLLVPLRPMVLVVNLANNDKDAGVLAGNLREMIALSRQHGIKTVICLEPNTIERWPGDMPNHPAMREVARECNVPCLDLHDYLRQHYDDGFLWWDFVHPTSFGHKLIADAIMDKFRANALLEQQAEQSVSLP